MDSSTTFVQAGTLPKPRVVGRTVRLLLGLVCCYTVLQYASIPDALLRPDLPQLFLLTGPAFALWLLPPVVNLGFGRSWKNRPRNVVLSCARVRYSSIFSSTDRCGDHRSAGSYGQPPYTRSPTLARVSSWRASWRHRVVRCGLSRLFGRLTGRTAQEHHCPGFITPLDNWEARRYQTGHA